MNYQSFASHVNELISSAPGESLSFAIENCLGPSDDFIVTTLEDWRKLGSW
jgi:hypothetical protein